MIKMRPSEKVHLVWSSMIIILTGEKDWNGHEKTANRNDTEGGIFFQKLMSSVCVIKGGEEKIKLRIQNKRIMLIGYSSLKVGKEDGRKQADSSDEDGKKMFKMKKEL